MNDKKVLLALLIMMVLGFAFWSKFNIQPDTAKKEPLEKVTVLLDWLPNTNHTGLYVAQQNGYFEKNGLDVTLVQPGESELLSVVAAGKADFGISSQEAVTIARAKDVPVVSVGAIIQHNTSAFASKKEASITSVSDFAGKRYGGWGSPIEEATIKALMEGAKADYDTVQNITLGTNDFFSSIGRETDFQWIFYGWDGVEASRRGIDLNLIWLKDLDPVLDYYTPVIVTNEAHIKEKKDVVRRFMRAVADGYGFAIKNPDKAAEILVQKAPELHKDLVQKSQMWLSPKYQDDALKWGVQNARVWEHYAKWLYEHKQIDNMIESDLAFTNEFLP